MTLSWSNEETFKFIELYQSEPAIWDPNNEKHKDKNKVNDAWNRIADSMQIPVSELKKKKETLMSAFWMHLKKKLDSIRSGMGEEEIYKPVWIFYDALEAFLKGKYTSKSIISTDEEKEAVGHNTKQETETSSDATSNTETKDTNIKIPVQRRRTIKPPELEKTEKEMSKAFNTLNQALNREQQNKIEDDCELYGRLLATKLRKYSDHERQTVMFEIDGLLLKRPPKYSPRYVNSPAEIIITKRPSSSGTNYSGTPPLSPLINRPRSSSTSSNNSHIKSQNHSPHIYTTNSPIHSPIHIPPPELPIAPGKQEVIYTYPNTIGSGPPTIHIPEESTEELYYQMHSQSILTDAYLRAMNADYKPNVDDEPNDE